MSDAGAGDVLEDGLGDEHRVRFPARPASVTAMRAWLTEELGGWGATEDRDDVLLAATELATNAVLHSGSPFFEVAVSVADDAVRFVAEDRGTSPAATIAHRRDVPSASGDSPEQEAATGRGLFLVSALTSAWGIEELEGGTRIWAAFTPGDADHTPRAPAVRADRGRVDPHGVRVIELLGCPPDLLLAHDANLADTARELRLFGVTHGDPATAQAAEQIAEVVRLSAVSWNAARLLAQQAVAAGLAEVDIATAPTAWAQVPDRVAVLRRAVALAESMMERGLLITLRAPEPVQRWRDWVEAEMVEQVTTGREPVRFSEWLSRTHGR